MNLRVALVLLAGCVPGCPPDPIVRCELPDDIAPSETRNVQIGDPFDDPFNVYADDERVGRTFGGQGGSHINVGFRIAALPSDGEELRCMRVEYQRTNLASGNTFDRDTTFEFERIGDWWESTSIIADQDLLGRATLRVTVIDRQITGSAMVTIEDGPEGFDAGFDAAVDIGPPDMGTPDVFDAGPPPPPLELEVEAYDPARHDCGPPAISAGPGMNLSPAVSWRNVPERAGSLALVLRNLDDGTVHWVAYNVPPTMTGLDEGVPAGYEVDGFRQARSDLNNGYHGYVGACSGIPQTYEWALYAMERETLTRSNEASVASEVSDRIGIDRVLAGATVEFSR